MFLKYIWTIVLYVAFSANVVHAGDSSGKTENNDPSLSPTMTVRVGKKKEELPITEVDVKGRIFGPISETEITLVFHNPQKRDMAGDLYFPLPEGATVSGYALDINEQMVDGVVVEKQKARQVFEKEMRKGIDPGIVQHSKGNCFKTRVFPIPAGGTRTISIKYVSDLIFEDGKARYILPLSLRKEVKQFNLQIDVLVAEIPPKMESGKLENFKFEKWEKGYRAKVVKTDFSTDKDIVVAISDPQDIPVLVEKTPNGEYFYMIHDFPQKPANKKRSASPNHICVMWDASGSREKADVEHEIALLTGMIKETWPKTLGGKWLLRVDLVVFRNAAEPVRRIVVNSPEADNLITEIEKIKYDGGTQIGALKILNKKPDFYLLFSDGLSTFGRETSIPFDAPVFVVSSSIQANHALLNGVAMNSGGAFFNLKRLSDKNALCKLIAATQGASLRFSSVVVENNNLHESFPSMPVLVEERFTLVGKLTGGDDTAVVNYNMGGLKSESEKYTVLRKNAVKGTLLRRYWAQRKINELMLDNKNNAKAIAAIGREFSIVTPGTSLIVLDRLEQYVEHGITPPESLPKMRKRYADIMEKNAVQKKIFEESKFDRILAMWDKRVKWWKTEFKYPDNFRHKKHKKAKRESINRPEPDTVDATDDDDDAETAAEAPIVVTTDFETTDHNETADNMEMETVRGEPDSISTFNDVQGSPALMGVGASGGRGGGGRRRLVAYGGSSRRTDKNMAKITMKSYDPKTPYLDTLKEMDSTGLFDAYIEQRKAFGANPAFYLDCASLALAKGNRKLSVQILSNIAELELENAALLRILAHRLVQIGEYELGIITFDGIREMRPEEPQSYRDLALALVKRAEMNTTADAAQTKLDYRRALELLAHVIMTKWKRFDEIEGIALMEYNALLPRAKNLDVGSGFLDHRLVKLLDCDTRILMSWDADMTDIDLHVIEPSGERCYYQHNRTVIGGRLSRDFTNGYGPEEYLIKKAMKGKYRIEANFYGSHSVSVMGAVTVQLDIVTNFGRDDEKRKSITVRLKEEKDKIFIGEVEF